MGDVTERRRFLKYLGLSSAGLTVLGSAQKFQDKAKGGEHLKEEIERLREAYEGLDKRSKLILRLVLMLSGLDLLTDLI
jgi:hypothetical protein